MATSEDLRRAAEFTFTGDNGDVSPEDNATFNILIAHHKEPLNVIALKLLTTFKRRCSWSIAVALIQVYENVFESNPIDLHSRIILIYLIFRVAELDGTDMNGQKVKREGNLSLPFLIRIAKGEEICHGKTSCNAEKYLAKMILSAQVDYIASYPAQIIAQLTEVSGHESIRIDEALHFYSIESARFPATSKSQEEEKQVDLITSKLFNGKALDRTEVRLILEAITKATKDSSVIQKFADLPINMMKKLIMDHVKIAVEAIYKLVERNPSSASTYMQNIMGMELAVQCIEVVLKLYTSDLVVDREPLLAFVSHCIAACDDADANSFKRARLVRLVCLFISCLLKKEILPVQDLLAELSTFVLNHSNQKETTNLYQALVEARTKLATTRRAD